MHELVNYPTPPEALQDRIVRYFELNEKLNNDDLNLESSQEAVDEVCNEWSDLVKLLLPRRWNSKIMPDYIVIAVDENDPLDSDPDSDVERIHTEDTDPKYPSSLALLEDPHFIRLKRIDMELTLARVFRNKKEYIIASQIDFLEYERESILNGESPYQPHIDIEYQFKLHLAITRDMVRYPDIVRDLRN